MPNFLPYGVGFPWADLEGEFLGLQPPGGTPG